MKKVAAAALRRSLFATLKRVSYEKEPVLIERRGRPIAVLAPPELAQGFAADSSRATDRSRPRLDPKAIVDFCTRHRLRTLYLFGSILTDDFGPDSDVDVMFEAEAEGPSYFEQMEMADELEAMFGRPVDLMSRQAVDAMTNRFRKQGILEGARVIYGRS
jgi:uncharacterized protein